MLTWRLYLDWRKKERWAVDSEQHHWVGQRAAVRDDRRIADEAGKAFFDHLGTRVWLPLAAVVGLLLTWWFWAHPR